MHKLVSMFSAVLLTTALLLPQTALGNEDTVRLAYVEWSDAVAATNVVKAVLEEELGYQVETVSVSAAAMWQAVATGNADAMVAAWLPSTHKNYYAKVKDQVDNLGPNLEGTKIGLVVPEYVTINSIAELDANAQRFGGEIVGIDPGAGIMSTTEQAIEDYDMQNINLMESSGATMTAVLADKVRRNEWTVVTGWTPHWMFARWDLKYLEDPEGTYGGEEHIATMARKGLKEEMPEVYNVLDNFYWSTEDVAQVMVWNQEEGADPYQTAKRYLKENPDKLQQWLK